MPADLVDRGHRFEAWTLPTGTFKRKFDLSRWVGYTIADKWGSINDGRLDLPNDFPKLAQLMTVDKANHANDVGSLIRVLNGITPINHYVLKKLDGRWSSTGETLTGLLEGMDYYLDRARVPNFDAPAAPYVEADWIYGAPSVLTNTDFENSPITTELVSLVINATAGTFTIGIDYPVGSGFQYTGNIAENVTAANLAIELENHPDLVDVAVSGLGTEANPFLIEVLDPGLVAMTWATDAALLTGQANITQLVNGGHRSTEPWTESVDPVTGLLHGSYLTFEISTEQAHTGSYSLKVDGNAPTYATDYPGAQQLFSVTPGRTFRASVWVYPTQTGPFALVIRTRDETYITHTTATLTAGSWQQLTITTVQIPSYVSQIIFRVATLSSANEPAWYVDDALLAPGMAADTYGKIMLDLLTAIQAEGVLTWVTPTWTVTNDSAGVLWDQSREWMVRHGQTLLQLVEHADRWNYESDSIHWDAADNRFEWGLYNPNGGGTNKQGTGVAVIGKVISESGTIALQIPDATMVHTEGDLGYWGTFKDLTLAGAWGPLQKFSADANARGLDTPELVEFATRQVTDAAKRTDGLMTRLQATQIKPWIHFKPGDRNIMVNLAPKRTRGYMRCMSIVATKGRDDAAPVYDAHWDMIVYQGEAAHLETTRRLVRQLRAITNMPVPRETLVNPVLPDEPEFIPTGRPEIIVASFDTDPELRNLADYVLGGDHVTPADASIFFADILTDLNMREGDDFGRKGEIIVLDGTYYFNTALTLATNAFGKLTFAGQGGPRFVLNYNTAPAAMFINTGGGSSSVEQTIRFHKIKFDGANKSNGHFMRQTTLTAHPTFHVAECVFKDFNLHVWWSERQSPYFVHDCEFYTCEPSDGMFHFDTGTTGRRLIHDNNFVSCTGNMVSGFDFADHTLIANNTRDQGTLALNAKTGVTYASNLWP